LKALRKERGLPIEVLARLARVGTWQVLLCEKYGIVPRSYSVRERIAGVLGVEPAELFGEVN
ncbi:MAG: hypothetical protein N2045_14030, partial [Fimbriimonadales bacterium]|nr:hypothetical protein [Fimbriimonadales bacterium]